MIVITRKRQRIQSSLVVEQLLFSEAAADMVGVPATTGLFPTPAFPPFFRSALFSSSASNLNRNSAHSQTDQDQDHSRGLDPEKVAFMVQRAFNRAPRETAMEILRGLGELDKVHLLLALQASTNRETLQKRDTDYVDDLLKIVKTSSTHSGLTRGQIANAIAYQRMLQRYSSYSHQPPTVGQLAAVMLASGLPFLGFGFCDNLVMILAGDAVDAMFGAKLGITTLASAGLGNIVADVVGVGVTQQIKEQSRRISWAQPPRLSTLQQAMGSVKMAKMGGACLGVSLGCLLGLLPLLVLPPGFFELQEKSK